ncbi:MAG: TauD/TfdA family dioxygenase [Methylophilaceae bacterium]
MKIQFENDTLSVNHLNKLYQIHPVWLRERLPGESYFDIDTHQRLYEPSSIDLNLKIKSAQQQDRHLNIEFNDGIQGVFNIDDLLKEMDEQRNKRGPLPDRILWDSQLGKFPEAQFEENMAEKKSMYDLLIDFYKFGFVIIKNVPTEDKYLLKFVNSIGPIKVTNFGEYFDVMSKPNPNDLAYKPIALPPHTDNPYRKPTAPGIQFLHCLKNEVSGGFSTLVDGFAVAEYIKKTDPEAFKALTETNIRFEFQDKDIVLENWGELIELDDDGDYKQVRYSTRVDYVPPLTQEKLSVFYRARKLLGDLYCSSQFELKFKLKPGDIMMFDNHRLLHGRTAYDANEGARHLQGCYLEFDATDGKLRHLARKFL